MLVTILCSMHTVESRRHDKRCSYEIYFEWAVKLNRLLLNFIGIWPNICENPHDRFLSNCRAMLTLLLILFMGVIPAIHSLIRCWGDMMSTIDNLQCTLPLLTTMLKLVIVWWKKTDLTLVINMIADDWMKRKSNKELQVMIKRAETARIITVFGYAFMFSALIIIVLLPCFGISMRYLTNITDPDKLLPLQSHYLYNKDQSPYYELTFIAQSIVILISATTYTGVDSLLGLVVFHVCGQLENLKGRLINLKQSDFNDSLAIIVKDHTRLIKCFDIIESTFTLMLLELLFYFSIVFCLYGFLVIATLTEVNRISFMSMIYFIAIVLNVCAHMCLYCVVGDVLVTQCEQLHYAIYEYEWYKLKPNEARTLILLMIRSSKPFHITAGKIFPMTITMFCTLIKTSTGYISVLLAKQA